MPGNPKDSKWLVTAQADRKRKQVLFTLSDAARAKLEAMAERRGQTLSGMVEELIIASRK